MQAASHRAVGSGPGLATDCAAPPGTQKPKPGSTGSTTPTHLLGGGPGGEIDLLRDAAVALRCRPRRRLVSSIQAVSQHVGLPLPALQGGQQAALLGLQRLDLLRGGSVRGSRGARQAEPGRKVREEGVGDWPQLAACNTLACPLGSAGIVQPRCRGPAVQLRQRPPWQPAHPPTHLLCGCPRLL